MGKKKLEKYHVKPFDRIGYQCTAGYHSNDIKVWLNWNWILDPVI